MSSYRTILSLIIFFSFGSADGYNLVDDYTVSNFFDMFTFYTGGDPTNGHVQYVNRNTASTNGYISTNPSSVYMGVDHAGLYPRGGPGRPSVRLISNHVYTHGLFILDLSHMPTGCGTWPAFWTLGPNWPTNGEIDIIEGVNLDQVNHMTLHSTPNCTIAGSGMIGRLETNNCAYYPGHNVGCGISAPPASNSYGDPFNLNGGGVYATEWTSANIKVWFFPRGSVPDTIVNSDASPDITQFGLPTAIFQGSCNFDEKFANHQIILNTDFCGDYAGNAYSSSSCPLTQGFSSWDSCVTFVGNNPQNFTEAYWSINSLRVYQNDAICWGSSRTERIACRHVYSMYQPV
ncbi:putative endo-1,3(4)-beta-glucanase [Tothia fuscella]|uniref:endo-1,3(4)-beta-glucanase n=1 Tax=Tothia fuscella TaxID=1048955 RepID=A0A9P4TSG8_9PEZI|nr:putative endo-1,3(4)-beta-glucanase [Tothia fuscella]